MCFSADLFMNSAVLLSLLLLLRQRHQGAPVVTVEAGHPGTLQDTGLLDGGAPQLFLDSTEPLQAVAAQANRNTSTCAVKTFHQVCSSHLSGHIQ